MEVNLQYECAAFAYGEMVERIALFAFPYWPKIISCTSKRLTLTKCC